jgi:hypothetical protein
MSICEIVGVCIALQLKKIHTKKESKGGWKTQSRQVCERHYWSVHKIPTSKGLSKIEHVFALQESPYSHNSKIITKFLNSHHSYDILGAGMLWKPKEARKFVKIR